AMSAAVYTRPAGTPASAQLSRTTEAGRSETHLDASSSSAAPLAFLAAGVENLGSVFNAWSPRTRVTRFDREPSVPQEYVIHRESADLTTPVTEPRSSLGRLEPARSAGVPRTSNMGICQSFIRKSGS